jgi:hypothetical protein
MKKTTIAVLFLTGVMAGFWLARSGSEVLAQAPPGMWECKSWTLGADVDAGNQVGPFLRNAGSVELTSTGLSSSRYALVACKR